jgi:hypothetical protein
LSVSKLPFKCAVVSLYSVVKQRLKCNTGTIVLSIEEESVFLVEYVFPEGNRYTDLVQERLADKFPQTPVLHRNAVRKLIEKFRETGSVLDAERSGRPSKLNDTKLMKIPDPILRSPSKSLRKLALVDITSSTFYKCTATFRKHSKVKYSL